MKAPIAIFFSLAAFTLNVIAQDSDISVSHNSGYYYFIGAEMLVQYKKNAEPIISADKRGIYVDIGKKKPKRFPWHTFCLFKPKAGISNRFVDFNELSYNFVYQKPSFREKEAYDTIRAKARETNIHIQRIRATQGNSDAGQEAIDMLETERDEFTSSLADMIDNDDLKMAGHADSIEVKMTLTPTTDIKDAYCAVMVDYNEISGKRRGVYKMSPLGDLLKDIPETTSFKLFLGEGDFTQSRFELYLFSGDGSQIATSESRGLRMLSLSELEEMANPN